VNYYFHSLLHLLSSWHLGNLASPVLLIKQNAIIPINTTAQLGIFDLKIKKTERRTWFDGRTVRFGGVAGSRGLKSDGLVHGLLLSLMRLVVM